MIIFRRLFNDASDDGMTYEWWSGKDLEESGRRIIEVITQNFPECTEENHEKPKSG
jgi:hypothetical protein